MNTHLFKHINNITTHIHSPTLNSIIVYPKRLIMLQNYLESAPRLKGKPHIL